MDMSIESITKRIEDEAKAVADVLITDAKSQKDSIVTDARIKAAQIETEAKERADKDSKILVERRESVAGLESRKMQLAAKQEVIAESFDKALDKLLALDESKYMDFMSKQLAAFEGQSGEILLNAADKNKYGAKLAKLIEKTAIKVSDDEAKIKGGFILKQGDISINCSMEKLLEDSKEEMMSTIAQKLFPSA